MKTPFANLLLVEPRLASPLYRYGMLGFILALAMFSGVVVAHLSPDQRGRYFGVLVPPLLLFNHLAFQFRWPSPLRVGLRIVAVLWGLLTLGYSLWVLSGR